MCAFGCPTGLTEAGRELLARMPDHFTVRTVAAIVSVDGLASRTIVRPRVHSVMRDGTVRTQDLARLSVP